MRTRYKEGLTINYFIDLYKCVSNEIFKNLNIISKIVSDLEFDKKYIKSYVYFMDDELSIRSYCDGVQVIIKEDGKRTSGRDSKVEAIKKENYMTQKIELKHSNYFYTVYENLSVEKHYKYNLTKAINKVFDLVNFFNYLPLYNNNGDVKYIGSITIDCGSSYEMTYFHIRDDKEENIFGEEYLNNKLKNSFQKEYIGFENVLIPEKDYKKIIKFFPKMKVNIVTEEKNKKKNKEIDKSIKDSSYIKDDEFYDPGKLIKSFYYDSDFIGRYNLSYINFDGANVSNLDFSRNPEININIEKVVKDFTNTSFKGVNLNKQVFKNAILIDTDLRETNATIDIMSCMINNEGKVNRGTIFDESNKFIMGNKKISTEEVRKMGIKILKKEK